MVVECIKEGAADLSFIHNQEGDVYSELLRNIVQLSSIKDDLTCLYNRRFLNECLPMEIHKSFLQNKPISIIYADIDHFKKVNDAYGHRAGDVVLCKFALIIEEHLDANKDWAVRIGGDEFVICLPGTNYKKSKIIAEGIKASLQKNAFVFPNDSLVCVTASFGVHTVKDRLEHTTVDSILHKADTKMYKAKKKRNTVV